MEIRDWRKDPFAQLQTAWAIAGQELFRRVGIDASLATYMVDGDFKEGIKTLISKKSEIENRPNGFVAYLDEDGQVYSETRDVAEILEYLKQKHLEQESGLGMAEIKGSVGSRGKTTGIVRIVPDANKVGHFNDGDVLVTGMTRPEFVPLMKRASAIVTDEGGITCHAAIVSRELKIPCIIGTKIATKVLKDGDLVEVNADKGVVRILERVGEKN
ncbi:hypothetical protein HY250_03475 [Candidatus Azambacteria bacterium]|nr:hypothetical protein [Candidatus Azambacteria bacterium]